MRKLLVYGKIIVDNIRLRGGEIVPGNLGGGGPQAAFGARLWAGDVALLTRSGADLDPVHERTLRSLDLDLAGWTRHPDLPTPRGLQEYDENERMYDHGILTSRDDWFALLARPIELSPRHRQAAGIHLVTEFGDEPMAAAALDLRRSGALMSVEPIFDDHSCPNRAVLLDFCRRADLVTPDWHSAVRMSGADDLAAVMRFWADLGPEAIAIRRGAVGSYVWDRQTGQAWHIPPLPVDVVDPTGAGNAYGGGWFAGWQQDRDARLAGCRATVAAALMVSHAGMPQLDSAARARAAELLEVAMARVVPLDSLR